MPHGSSAHFILRPLKTEDCFKIGYVVKPHGLKGEVTVILTEPLDLNDVKSLFADINGALVPYFIERLSDRGDKVFVKLDEVDGPDQAAALKGKSLYIPKKERPSLLRGQFYDDEVVGFNVVDRLKGPLGSIREVLAMGPNRFLALSGPREVLIPIQGPFIQSVNKSKRIITVDLPDGFLDI